jgi:hypothetical protein
MSGEDHRGSLVTPSIEYSCEVYEIWLGHFFLFNTSEEKTFSRISSTFITTLSNIIIQILWQHLNQNQPQIRMVKRIVPTHQSQMRS